MRSSECEAAMAVTCSLLRHRIGNSSLVNHRVNNGHARHRAIVVAVAHPLSGRELRAAVGGSFVTFE
jgi:hypothetical protein